MKCQLRDGADGNKYVVGFFGNKICNEKLQAEFPGGIVLGQSTREDVKKAYGEDSYDVYRGFGVIVWDIGKNLESEFLLDLIRMVG